MNDIIRRLRDAIAADFERMIGTALTKDITALLDRLDAAERDAARWRYFKARAQDRINGMTLALWLEFPGVMEHGSRDAAIDAAREAEK